MVEVSRGLSPEIIAELAKPQITLVYLFAFEWKTMTDPDTGLPVAVTPDYLADGRKDVVWNGHTFRASGDMLEIPAIKEVVSPSLDSVSLVVSGVNMENIFKVLAYDYTNIVVTIYRGLLNASLALVADPVEIYVGYISAPEVSEDPGEGTSRITWKITSQWAMFERTAGRRCNDADQQKHYPGDLGLQYAAQSLTDIKWGST